MSTISPTPAPRDGLAARFFPAALAVAVVGFGLYFDHAASAVQQRQLVVLDEALAAGPASPEVRRVARWAVATQDTAGFPFVIVDKVQSRIYAFDPQGRPVGNTAVRVASADKGLVATRTQPSVAYVIERADGDDSTARSRRPQ